MLKTIYIVSTPIGNLEDISARARSILEQSSVIVVEEYKTGKKMLDLLGIPTSEKELYELNEHNEEKEAEALFEELYTGHRELALISDGGTPLIADPGAVFLKLALRFDVTLKPVPGPCSVTAALTAAAFPLESYYYAGFLPRREGDRMNHLRHLAGLKTVLVIMETPYRLGVLICAAAKALGPHTPAALCWNLTRTQERIERATLGELSKRYANTKRKELFVLVINGRAATLPRSRSKRGSDRNR